MFSMILHRRGARTQPVLKGQGSPALRTIGAPVALAIGSLFLLTGASEPEVIRVRLPAQDISRLFPAGTELRVMTAADFEAKVAAAFQGQSSTLLDRSPRLIRARHQARVSSGVLTGTSDLVIEPARAGPGEYVLEPWTPAIVPSSGTAGVVRARFDGKPTLWIDQGSTKTIHLEWELQARAYSRGRGFVLRLPGGETSSLSLDIPQGWEPASRRGIRRGPLAGQALGQNHWEVDAELGRIDVHIYDPGGAGQASLGPVAWLTSATEVDLRGRKERARGAANWTTLWHISLDPRNAGQLGIELDAGLDLVDVIGPKVQRFRAVRQGLTTRVEVSLDSDRNPSTELRIFAHVDVPREGAWTIPSARPSSAVWTGGTTTVLFDDDIAVSEYREKSGRRVFPVRGNLGSDRRLEFESQSAGPAAELVFAAPRADSSCEVRGQLYVSNSPSRLECKLTWRVERGLLPELRIDLSPGWVPDQVRFREFSDPATWRYSVQESGATRIQVAVPPAAIARKELTLEMEANSTMGTGRGPLELPRVRPAGTRIADEVWLAWVDNDTLIRPSRARGLAWIDPKGVLGGANSSASATELREALAWRWISDPGSATIDRQRVDEEPQASITTSARLDPSGLRLAVLGRIVIDAGGEGLGAIPVWVNQPDDPLKSWRFRAETGGSPVETRPIEPAAVAPMGFPKGGSARNVLVDIRPGTSKTISFETDIPWTYQGPVPLLFVPSRYLSRSIIELEVPPSIRSRLETVGLRRLEPSVFAQVDGRAEANQALPIHNELVPGRNPNRQSFIYTEPTSRLELATQLLSQSRFQGIIQEAVLATTARPGGRSLNRLRLLVQAGEARSLAIKPRDGLSIVRCRRDGSDIVPTVSKSGLSIPLDSTSSGSRISTVVLEYELEGKTGADGARLRPTRPQVEMPCLSFIWEVITPSGWEPVEWNGGLVAYDPPDRSHWPFAALRVWMPWSLLAWGRTAEQDSGLYQELDGRLKSAAADTISFGEWFTRWDSGLRPVVIDRLSLDLTGLGPKSPCVLTGIANRDRSDISLATLRRNGLALVKLRDALLVTTEDKARDFEMDDRAGEAVVETLIWGSDRTDRLQTVARWRGEPSPRSSIAAGEAITERSRVVPGWSNWRFSGADWPAETASIRIVDRRASTVSAWFVAAMVLCFYLRCRGWLVRWRAVVLLSVLAAGALLAGLAPARWESYPAAIVIAGVVAIVLEISAGQRSRLPARRPTGQGSGEMLAVRAGILITGGLFAGLLAANFRTAWASGSPDRASAILALFPDEGPAFDPTKPAQNVILRLSDFNRLERLARDASQLAPAPSAVRALSASHRIVRENARNIRVESEYELIAPGRSPGTWELPVSSTRDIEVSLDEKPQAISVQPGGATAVLEIPPASRHVLRVRRTASAKAEVNSQVLRIPINAMPLARVIVEPAQDGAGEAELAAGGRVERRADQTLLVRLGPAGQLEIRWPRIGPARAASEGGSVDALLLWDIHPGGDRVRARFKLQQDQEGGTLKIRHDPRLILRSADVSDRLDRFWVESSSGDEWTLHTVSSIGRNSLVSIDCWLPIAADSEKEEKPVRFGGGFGARIRRMPRFQPVGMERCSGIFGVRRPGDWTGRVDPMPLAEPVGDESFVRAWGDLGDEPLTLCGTGRFVGECTTTLRTGPGPSRVQVRPSVQLNVESGRVAMTVDAEIIELAGHVLHLDLTLPENLRIVDVTGEGLTGWRMGPDRRLRLMFDRPVVRTRRQMRIAGWIPYGDDPFKSEAKERRLPTPWIKGDGIEPATGFLTISSASKTSLLGADGLTLISSESSPPVGSIPFRQRYSYQVDDPRKLGEIIWEPIATRVSVAIESQMTLHPDSAEWAAVLRYDVSGGSLDSIHLRMPAAWSEAAKLQFTGGECRLSKESIGPSAIWTITPRRPIWGSARFVLKSALPLAADREVVHPELAPLGWGAVDAYVGIVNATGRPLSVGKSTGLQSIPYATKFRSKDFVVGVGTQLAAFRVTSKEWILQVQSARSESQADILEQSRVALADLLVSISADGSATGRAAYDLYSGGGRGLAFELPPTAVLLGVTIDSVPAQPLRDAARRWSIVLENRHPARVCVIWRTPPTSAQASDRRIPLKLPRAGIGQAPALLAVHLAPGMIVDADLGGLEPAPPSRFELARAERLGRLISDLADRIDRSSGRDHEKLVSLLINQELALRAAERSIRWSDALELKQAGSRSERESAFVRTARTDSIETLRQAGLEEDLASAQAYLGQSPKGSGRPMIGAPELFASDRIRSPGDRTTFVGVVAGVDAPPAGGRLTIESQSRDGVRQYPRARGLLLVVAVVGISLLTTVFRRRVWVDSLAFAFVLAVAGYWGGPVVLVGATAITAVAWWIGRGYPVTQTAL
jgi:hypothetical protein